MSLNIDCMGCALVDGSLVPIGGIIKETKHFILHQDPEVPIVGFLIIASKAHVKSVTAMTEEQTTELFRLVCQARQALLICASITECTLIQEERSKHFHFWLLPRHEWMEDLFPNSLSSVRPMMKYAEENLNTEENLKAVEECVAQVRKFLDTR